MCSAHMRGIVWHTGAPCWAKESGTGIKFDFFPCHFIKSLQLPVTQVRSYLPLNTQILPTDPLSRTVMNDLANKEFIQN